MRSPLAPLLLLSSLVCLSARAETVTMAVASNFLSAAEAVAADWTAATGTPVRIIPGSSGKHAAMILNGGPVDLFLSADAERPDALEAAGLVRLRATYAIGRLVVWAPGSAEPMRHLTDGGLRRLAVADAALAPYGLAAQQALTALGLSQALAGRLVVGENIGQTFGFVATGNADIGLVALSQVIGFDGAAAADWTVLDAGLHDPIRQDMVVTTRAGPEAEALFGYLLSAPAQARIAGFGYRAPDP